MHMSVALGSTGVAQTRKTHRHQFVSSSHAAMRVAWRSRTGSGGRRSGPVNSRHPATAS